MNRAVFLDRDGVLNYDRSYLSDPDELELLPGAAEAVARLNAAGWVACVITNQSGVGRGLMTLDQLNAVQERLREGVEAAGGILTGLYACLHAPEDDCACRKPKPGLILQAAAEHNLDLAQSWMIGDSPRDLAAGHSAGCKTALAFSGHTRLYAPADFPPPLPEVVVADLAAFADWLLSAFP